MDAKTEGLSYLIPISPHDIAVQKILKPLFGDVVTCKIPGEVCGNMAPTDAGSLLASIISVFNGGTMIFATIMLIFIGIVGFVKTANDGEFFGRTWNTTFTALRLVAGIGFLLPMPNGYSAIQNVVIYVGLWSSGAANAVVNVTSEHYLRRLQVNMTAHIDPSATSVQQEAAGLLAMHTCAAFTNQEYRSSGATLIPQWSNLGGPSKVEFAWVEAGTYLARGSSPCGRLVIEPLGKIVVDAKSGVPARTWNAAFFVEPLTSAARKLMTDSVDDAAKAARVAKVDALRALTEPDGPMVQLGRRIATRYGQSLPVYNDDGSIARGPEIPVAFDSAFTGEVLDRYAAAVRAANNRLTTQLDAVRTQVLEKAKADGSGSFFSEARTMLQDGGWMATAMTHRTMLDMVSVQFIGAQQKPSRIEPSELLMVASGANVGAGSGGVGSHVQVLDRTLDRIFSSDTGRTVLNGSLGAPEAGHGAMPAINRASLDRIVSDPSPSGAFEVLYGSNFLEGYRAKLLRALSIGEGYDPLYQVKSIGDATTAVGEYLVLGRMAWDASLSAVEVGGAAATGNVVGQVTGANSVVEALVRGAARVMETPLTIAGWLAGALTGIGYLFSTWLPALPVLAMMLAQIGWLLGLVMTLFAVNIWAVLHLTPAQSDTFVGSQVQGYLLIAGLFFRPLIAVSALSISFLIAPPLMQLVNLTLLPAMFSANVSTNTLTVFTATVFGLVLYFTVAKALLVMVFMLPQSFPDEVLRFVGAGIGDLGQSKGMAAMEYTSGVSERTQDALRPVIPRAKRNTATAGKEPPPPPPQLQS